MTVNILTLFPEMFSGVLSSSILKRAIGQELIKVNLINFRDFTKDKYGRVDTPPIGGGAGLVLKVQPIVDALASIPLKGTTILLTPRGTPYTQKEAIRLSKLDQITLICGHYEGFDERIHPFVDEMISMGDYILTGGEIAALAIIDSVTRLLPGVIDQDSPKEESFSDGLLEYPQYTEPKDYKGMIVPDILYSGHHEAIRMWRLKESFRLTKTYRPDLLKTYTFTKKTLSLFQELDQSSMPDWETQAILKGKR
jgi:tRNA (guanine37-N1)-methyltransferase